jgi:hypothetical protein
LQNPADFPRGDRIRPRPVEVFQGLLLDRDLANVGDWQGACTPVRGVGDRVGQVNPSVYGCRRTLSTWSSWLGASLEKLSSSCHCRPTGRRSCPCRVHCHFRGGKLGRDILCHGNVGSRIVRTAQLPIIKLGRPLAPWGAALPAFPEKALARGSQLETEHSKGDLRKQVQVLESKHF